MITVADLNDAFALMRSNGDFPMYVRAIANLGVIRYSTYVADGHSDFYGRDSHEVSTEPLHNFLQIAIKADTGELERLLGSYQSKSDISLDFFTACAMAGIKKWTIDIEAGICTYFDKTGLALRVEKINNV